MKHADVVSGGEEFALLVWLTGSRDSHIGDLFMIFKNPDCNYPIRNMPDTVVGVDYRSGKEGRMDRRVITEWLSGNCMNSTNYNNRRI